MYLMKTYKDNKKCFGTLLVCMFLISFAAASYANSENGIDLERLLSDYKDQYYDYNEGPGAESLANLGAEDAGPKYIYEKPYFKAISHLYWALGYHKIENIKAVDQYMIINECDMYTNFSPDELEWKEIRTATQRFLTKNKGDFPTRFEFEIPLKLGDYDKKRQTFNILKEYQIASSRRFEFLVKDFNMNLCFPGFMAQSIYPTNLIVEYSRPVRIIGIPMSEESANAYIKGRRRFMIEKYDKDYHSAQLLKNLRNAYLVMKVKFFTHGKLTPGRRGQDALQLMGVLEGYDIYESINKQNLMYSESYVSFKKEGAVNVMLQEQLEFLRKKSEGKGMLH